MADTLIDLSAHVHLIRGQKVMPEADLTELYGVETRVLNQAVRRNIMRFPEAFMLQLGDEETVALRSQFVTSKPGRGGRRYNPYVFTEHDTVMLASVLNSERKVSSHDQALAGLIDAIRQLMNPAQPTQHGIGFTADISNKPSKGS